MQTFETFYVVKYGIEMEDQEIKDLLIIFREQCKLTHINAGATVDRWFEFEKIDNPFEKNIFGSILGKKLDGAETPYDRREQEEMIDNQVYKMVEKARSLLNFCYMVEV